MTSHAQITDSFDVIIVGSGAGALSAAVFAADNGMSVLVVEKSDKYGGTSALSGGAAASRSRFSAAILGAISASITMP